MCLTFVVFFLTNLQPNLEKLAKTQANNRMTDDQVISWLARNGYDRNLFVRYGEWLGVVPGWQSANRSGKVVGKCVYLQRDLGYVPNYCGLLQGKLGYTSLFQGKVEEIIGKRLALTGKLMFWVMLVMVPSALLVGVMAGMREEHELTGLYQLFQSLLLQRQNMFLGLYCVIFQALQLD